MRIAGICLAWILAGCVAAVILGYKANILRQTPFPHSPEILAQKADEMIQSFGFTARLVDHAFNFSFDTAYLTYAEKQGKPSAYRDQLAKGQPPLIHFWYRQSPEPLIVSSPFSDVSPDDPTPIVCGMIGLSLDPQGRLLQLDAVPPQIEERRSAPGPFDWKALFTAAGLDLTRFPHVEPQWISLAPLRCASRVDRNIRECPGDSNAHRSGFLAWEAGVLRSIGPWSGPGRTPQFPVVQSGAWMFRSAALVALALGLFFAGEISGRNEVTSAERTGWRPSSSPQPGCKAC